MIHCEETINHGDAAVLLLVVGYLLLQLLAHRNTHKQTYTGTHIQKYTYIDNKQ